MGVGAGAGGGGVCVGMGALAGQLCTDAIKNNEKWYFFQAVLSSFRIGKMLIFVGKWCALQVCLNAVIRGLNQNLVILN